MPKAHGSTSRGDNGPKKCQGHGKGPNPQPRTQGQQNRGPPKGGNLTPEVRLLKSQGFQLQE